jgi:hypothetical protein
LNEGKRRRNKMKAVKTKRIPVFNMSDTEGILTECEAIEIGKIAEKNKLGFYPLKLMRRVFDRAVSKSNRDGWFYGILDVYMLGYVYGVRAERRKRRRESATTC